MTEIEKDSLSIESGSCDCSEYNSDMSWFYNSKNLSESSTHFSIIQNKKKLFEEKNIISNELTQDKKNEEINQFPIKVNLNIEPQKILMPKNIKSENNIQNDNTNLNIARKFTNYRSKYRMALKNKNEMNQKDEGYNSDTNNENKNEKNDEAKEENTRVNNRHLTHKININKKIDINNTENENKGRRINFFRRFHAINKNNKEQEYEKDKEITQNNNKEKDDEITKDNNKEKNQTNTTNESFRTKFFNSYKNFSRFRGKYKEEREREREKEKEKENNIKEEKNTEPLNEPIRLKTLKEKIVNETKNLPLQPGQTIKPKIVTTRKLKPITNIVTNDDGTQNIIIENTTLTTTIINEILDESNKENDEYPLDIQLVRQHITKKYVTEIESNPYHP